MTAPTITVIVPALNAEDTLDACLQAINASERRPDAVILYNDGSTDATAEIAARHGARVITNEGAPVGPGVGRNRSVAETDSDIVVFVDADVEVAPEAIGRLADAISNDKSVAAAFGSYDDAPPTPRLSALYANLRHHFVHQKNAGDASTFWSGLGAVERKAFLEVGGFAKDFTRPSIEDVEMGVRLRQNGGRILLVADALSKHHKDWTVQQIWRTDVLQRAVPWSHLILTGRLDGAALNTSHTEKLLSILAHSMWVLAFLFAVLGVAAHSWQALAGAGFAAAFALYIVINTPFYTLLARAGGARLVFVGGFLHWTYHLYASATFAAVGLIEAWKKLRSTIKAAARDDRPAL